MEKKDHKDSKEGTEHKDSLGQPNPAYELETKNMAEAAKRGEEAAKKAEKEAK
jgi:hypothetical protein